MRDSKEEKGVDGRREVKVERLPQRGGKRGRCEAYCPSRVCLLARAG
jgi:hypothetical protein